MQRNNLLFHCSSDPSLLLFALIYKLPFSLYLFKIIDRMWRNDEFRTNCNSYGDSF